MWAGENDTKTLAWTKYLLRFQLKTETFENAAMAIPGNVSNDYGNNNKEWSHGKHPRPSMSHEAKPRGISRVEGRQNSLFPVRTILVIKCFVISPNLKIEQIAYGCHLTTLL